ncbi:MAG: hypothetical protein M5U18_04365 [Dehalococcoidia bacterium]|nr:hypothetical protein [Dehalococcoidia bacterium]
MRVVGREGRDDRVETGAIGETCIDQRAGLVQPATQPADRPADDPEQLGIVIEHDIGQALLTVLDDESPVRAVDDDLFDPTVVEQRLEWPEPEDLVDQPVCEAFGIRQRGFSNGGCAVVGCIDQPSYHLPNLVVLVSERIEANDASQLFPNLFAQRLFRPGRGRGGHLIASPRPAGAASAAMPIPLA